MWPAVKQEFDQEHFRRYVAELTWNTWRPSKIVWHNTAAPSLAQWMKSANEDQAVPGRAPGITRINNLERYFRFDNGWSGCPHLFIAPDLIWVMNSLTAPGVHSPSFNNTAIGIEMIGDFSKEDDETGDGLRVKQNTIFVTAVLCSTLGLDPATAILLHKEDPRTTHNCPGEKIARDKANMIKEVEELMSGGEHDPAATSIILGDEGLLPKKLERKGITTISGLQFRRGPGVNNESTGSLPKGITLVILDEAKNASTTWLKVRSPAGFVGWVSARYVEINNGT